MLLQVKMKLKNRYLIHNLLIQIIIVMINKIYNKILTIQQ